MSQEKSTQIMMSSECYPPKAMFQLEFGNKNQKFKKSSPSVEIVDLNYIMEGFALYYFFSLGLGSWTFGNEGRRVLIE